jgi:hypothetical protein
MITATKPGRRPSDPADIAARRKAFQRLRHLLGMSAAEVAQLTGLSAGTVRNYFADCNPATAATWDAIEIMRQAAIEKTVAEIRTARDRVTAGRRRLDELDSMAA